MHVLVLLVEPLSFRPRCSSFLLSKLCFIIKVSTICGAGQDTRNLCYKFNSKVPALRILGFRVTFPKFQEPSSRVLIVSVPYTRIPVPESWVSGYCVLGAQIHSVTGPRVPGSWVLESQVSGSGVSGPDLRLCHSQL